MLLYSLTLIKPIFKEFSWDLSWFERILQQQKQRTLRDVKPKEVK